MLRPTSVLPFLYLLVAACGPTLEDPRFVKKGASAVSDRLTETLSVGDDKLKQSSQSLFFGSNSSCSLLSVRPFKNPSPFNAVGLSDQSLELKGERTVAVGGRALGTLLRSSGTSSVVGLDRVKTIANGAASLNVDAWLTQCGRADALSVVAVRESYIEFNSSKDSAAIVARIEAKGAKATAIGLQSSVLVTMPGSDLIEVNASISGFAGSGSQAIGIVDSFVSGNVDADKIVIRATGPSAQWGLRSAVFGGPGDDVIDLSGRSTDVLVRGRLGADTIILGRTRCTDPEALYPKPETGGVEFRKLCTISGDEGFNTLVLTEYSARDFLASLRLEAGLSAARIFFLGSDRTSFKNIASVKTKDGQVFDLRSLEL